MSLEKLFSRVKQEFSLAALGLLLLSILAAAQITVPVMLASASVGDLSGTWQTQNPCPITYRRYTTGGYNGIAIYDYTAQFTMNITQTDNQVTIDLSMSIATEQASSPFNTFNTPSSEFYLPPLSQGKVLAMGPFSGTVSNGNIKADWQAPGSQAIEHLDFTLSGNVLTGTITASGLPGQIYLDFDYFDSNPNTIQLTQTVPSPFPWVEVVLGLSVTGGVAATAAVARLTLRAKKRAPQKKGEQTSSSTPLVSIWRSAPKPTTDASGHYRCYLPWGGMSGCEWVGPGSPPIYDVDNVETQNTSLSGAFVGGPKPTLLTPGTLAMTGTGDTFTVKTGSSEIVQVGPQSSMTILGPPTLNYIDGAQVGPELLARMTGTGNTLSPPTQTPGAPRVPTIPQQTQDTGNIGVPVGSRTLPTKIEPGTMGVTGTGDTLGPPTLTGGVPIVSGGLHWETPSTLPPRPLQTQDLQNVIIFANQVVLKYASSSASNYIGFPSPGVNGLNFLHRGTVHIVHRHSHTSNPLNLLLTPAGLIIPYGTDFTVDIATDGAPTIQVLEGAVQFYDPITNNSIIVCTSQALILPSAGKNGYRLQAMQSGLSSLNLNAANKWWETIPANKAPIANSAKQPKVSRLTPAAKPSSARVSMVQPFVPSSGRVTPEMSMLSNGEKIINSAAATCEDVEHSRFSRERLGQLTMTNRRIIFEGSKGSFYSQTETLVNLPLTEIENAAVEGKHQKRVAIQVKHGSLYGLPDRLSFLVNNPQQWEEQIIKQTSAATTDQPVQGSTTKASPLLAQPTLEAQDTGAQMPPAAITRICPQCGRVLDETVNSVPTAAST